MAEVYAAAGGNPVTVGFALGSGSEPALTRLGGISVFCLPWGACAVAAARLVPNEGRLLAVIAKGAVNGLRQPGPSEQSINVRLEGGPNSPRGTVSSGVVTNPFDEAATVVVTGAVDDYVTLNGRRVGQTSGNLTTVNETMSAAARGTIAWTLQNPSGGFAGGDLTFRFSAGGRDVVPISVLNAEQAIPALDTEIVLLYGSTTAWWPLGEALAMAGTWMRRRSWADINKRIRFVAGAGTTPAVLVVIDASRTTAEPVLSSDFGAGEFLATDWETWAVGDAPAVDVSDFRFEERATPGEGFFFAVDGTADPGGGGGPGDPPAPPTTGIDEVRMRRNGVEQWVPVQPFSCPL